MSPALWAFALLFLSCICGDAQTTARPLKANLPARDEIDYGSVTQESDGNLKHLIGDSYVQTSEMRISADKIDFDTDTDWTYAHGHVHMEHYATGDKIDADHAEYNIRTEEGKFYVVDGTSPSKVMTSPGVLTTTNPFYFQAKWAERIKDRYILHQGFLTDCKIPKPWWIFQAPVFDIVPGNRAIARHTVLRLKRVPIFYLPYFYRPLGRNPRRSGFLTPNVGHSSLYGYMFGAGYYQALGRSYDMTGIVQDFTARGPAFTYDFRGKPSEVSDFNFRLYSVDDQGVLQPNGTRLKQGGTEFEITGSTQILGFTGRIDYNYLSSFTFRQEFSYSFASAVYNEVLSSGFLQRRFDHDTLTLSLVVQRNVDYIAATPINQPQNQVVVQKLPSLEFSSRDQQLIHSQVPVWFSLASSAGVLTRDEPTGTENTGGPPNSNCGPNGASLCDFHSGQVGRVDIEPHVYTAFRWKGLSLEPGITLAATDYTNRYASNTTSYAAEGPCAGYPVCPPTPTTAVALANSNLFRKDADMTLDLRLPTLERVYTPARWMHLGKLKHVVETEAAYEYVTGASMFDRIIHFDATDIVSNTNQLTLSLVNRLYRKDKSGNVSEIATWKVAQARYFDPTFGGAAVSGQRSVTLATEEISPYAFLTGPRNYSPVVSTLTLNPYGGVGAEWRAEYDPLLSKMIVNSYSTSYRHKNYFGSVGETSIASNPLLFPQSNQITFGAGYGSTNRKGWNVGATDLYDILLQRNVFQFLQGSYNTDCCGFSLQYRRINFGIRDENQYLFSFSLANLGTFGSLQKQERIF